jgi:hypothetical protein
VSDFARTVASLVLDPERNERGEEGGFKSGLDGHQLRGINRIGV